jgi:tetratricopeptide (TPR) repeat protein
MTRTPRPIYYSYKEEIPVENAKLVPHGMLYALVPRTQPPARSDLWQRATYRNLTVPTVSDFRADCILSAYWFFGALDALLASDEALALQRFETAGRYADGIPEMLNNIGVALGEAGRHDLAIAYCLRAVDADPAYDLARWNLFSLYRLLDRPADARAQLDSLLALDPSNQRALSERAALTSKPDSLQ